MILFGGRGEDLSFGFPVKNSLEVGVVIVVSGAPHREVLATRHNTTLHKILTTGCSPELSSQHIYSKYDVVKVMTLFPSCCTL